jgi:four helix bundle protein
MMDGKKKFIPLKDLEIYQLSRKLSAIAWGIYSRLSYQEKKTWGDQMLESIDSVGANIAEGYGRYHYLEKMRFYFISRASLSEGKEHWLDLGFERGQISQEEWDQICVIHKPLQIKLNNMISKTYESKKGGENERS